MGFKYLVFTKNIQEQIEIGIKDLKILLGVSKETYVQNGKFNSEL